MERATEKTCSLCGECFQGTGEVCPQCLALIPGETSGQTSVPSDFVPPDDQNGSRTALSDDSSAKQEPLSTSSALRDEVEAAGSERREQKEVSRRQAIAEARHREAFQLMHAGRVPEAIGLWENVIELDPELDEAYDCLERARVLASKIRGESLPRKHLVSPRFLYFCAGIIICVTLVMYGLNYRQTGSLIPWKIKTRQAMPLKDVHGQVIGNMIMIPAGEFLMGATHMDMIAGEDEKPALRVRMPAYLIDRTEVTNQQYCRFLSEVGNQREGNTLWIETDREDASIRRSGGGFYVERGKERFPVNWVNWYGAKAYAKWAGKRLPTEAEWEKAARGIDGRRWPWGNDPEVTGINSSERALPQPGAVGTHEDDISPYGCFDMAGNIKEWCADYYDRHYYKYASHDSPRSGKAGFFLSVRGGAFTEYVYLCRTTQRSFSPPDYKAKDLGFRCACSVTPADLPSSTKGDR